MKKTISISLMFLVIVLLGFFGVQNVSLEAAQTGISGSAPLVDIIGSLNMLVNYLFGILLIVGAMFLIIAGYFFVTSQGDPGKFEKARNFVLYALIGILVAFCAKGLISLIAKIVGEGTYGR